MDKLSLDNFDWGWMNDSNSFIGQYHKGKIIQEIYTLGLYEKFFEVENKDIVLDVGASHGPFTYSILHKSPKHVYCIEPSEVEFPILVKNTVGFPVTHINKGISESNETIDNSSIFGENKKMDGITFDKLIILYNLEEINFLKTDCEGGEYNIFNEFNLDYVTKHVKKIVGEWHLSTPELKESFRNFRQLYLTRFNNFNVYSVDNVDIKWDIWNEHFIEYYNEVIIYIDNR